MKILGVFLLLVWAMAIVLSALGSILVRKKFREYKSVRGTSRKNRRPITILKPVRGITDELKQSIYSFSSLDYSSQDELIFCVESPADPCYSFIRSFVNKFQGIIPVRLVVNGITQGGILNPKIRNIYKAFCSAKNDLVLISDDDVQARFDYLDRLNEEFDGGILTAIILARDPLTFSGQLEQMMMMSFYTKGLVLTEFLGHSCVMGKSMMFSKMEINHECMLIAGEYLAEDYAFGDIARRLGLKIKFLSHPVDQRLSRLNFGDFWNRHIRWGRLRKYIAPWGFIVEPFIFSMIGSGLCGSLALKILEPNSIWLFLLCHCIFWITQEKSLTDGFKKASGACIPTNPLAYLVTNLLHPFMWLDMAISNRTYWRGRTYKLKLGGKIKQ